LKKHTTNTLDINGSVLTSTVNGVSATIDIGSIIADMLYIQTGEKFSGNGDSASSKWPLYSGIGERSYTTAVKFDSPFRVPPKVSVALSGLEVDESTNTRIHVVAENITVDGFDLVYKTWSNTVLCRAWATWTAIGLKP
jgi:H-type lectin domain